jgi:Flp pilus assembly protein TadG
MKVNRQIRMRPVAQDGNPQAVKYLGESAPKARGLCSGISITNHKSQIRNGQKGQSLLETAMMIVVIFTIVFWVFELGWLMYTYTVMADAANEGVRYAVVRSGDNTTAIQSYVTSFAQTSLHDVSSISVSVNYPNGTAPPNKVTVTVTYTYVPWLSGYISTPTLHTYAEGNMIR